MKVKEYLYKVETTSASRSRNMVEVKGLKLTVILRKEEEEGYSAQCLELPGAISEGETRKETLANIREAIEGYLEAFPEEMEQLKRKRELVQITV
jgi:predicted RNase H-like HicB family nuclease